MNTSLPSFPQILAPAGNKAAFLAALAAGADAVYCGLKQLSARMEAKNFTLDELAGLTELAHEKNTHVYITLNTLLKPDEIHEAGKLLDFLRRFVHPDALIIQDLAWVDLAAQTGFQGELHLSTLANVSFAAALPLLSRIPKIRRVVLPRELGVDEIRQIAGGCPDNIGLEVFIHGALCYGVSGRCYWSSFLGGKSGLRGRCVQPCRRLYTQGRASKRFFSCQDLSLDVLVKILLSIPAVRAWKIEGRKKNPHYVYHTVLAYRMLRDHVQDARMRKEALSLLSLALGRTGTHYGFLSQRPRNPVQVDRQTGSGLCVGHVSGDSGNPCVDLQEALIPGDVIRIGYEDEAWHTTLKISCPAERNSAFPLPSFSGKRLPNKGVSVFLTDRREPALMEKIAILEAEIRQSPSILSASSGFQAAVFRKRPSKTTAVDQHVYRLPQTNGKDLKNTGFWMSLECVQSIPDPVDIWWWLTPVLWPVDEEGFGLLVHRLLEKGCRRFVLNAPWQIVFFPNPGKLSLWAGPFCNLSNPLAINSMQTLGFSGVIVSPELGQSDYLSLPLQCSLPLGMVLSGNWPLSMSRVLAESLKPDTAFDSPRGERAWASHPDANYWIYPNWTLDLKAFRGELEKAGYRKFIHLTEPVPDGVMMKHRPGNWNWKLSLL